MSRELIYYPDPILKEGCEPVEDPGKWSDLIESMAEVLYEHHGVGLAAPQVGEPVEIFTLRLDTEDRVHETYINPRIHGVSDEEPTPEGCLSFPDVTVEIERGRSVHFSATTPAGKEIERTVEGLQAQCVQHEVDHLQGKSLIDHCNLTEKMKIDEKIKSTQDRPREDS